MYFYISVCRADLGSMGIWFRISIIYWYGRGVGLRLAIVSGYEAEHFGAGLL